MKPNCSLPFATLVISLAWGGGILAEENICATPTPCKVSGPDGGTYYLQTPKGWDGKTTLKPFVFFHGHSGSGAGVVKNRRLVKAIGTQGYVLVAPDGPIFKFGNRKVRGWAARRTIKPTNRERNDIKFVEKMLADMSQRLPVDLKQTVVSGFSSGASMAWYFGCYSKAPLAGVVAVAGGLRRPLPDIVGSLSPVCPGGPRRVLHIHGFGDMQVPLEGRAIRAWHQGDIFEGLDVQRNTNRCGSRPDKIEIGTRLWCRQWTKCESGKPIRLCLHKGGHSLPKGWLDETFRWIEAAKIVN